MNNKTKRPQSSVPVGMQATINISLMKKNNRLIELMLLTRSCGRNFNTDILPIIRDLALQTHFSEECSQVVCRLTYTNVPIDNID